MSATHIKMAALNIFGANPRFTVRDIVYPIKYLWDTRVDHGLRMLKETGYSVAEIAFRSGFQDPYHFSKVVKKHLGTSPREYRQTN